MPNDDEILPWWNELLRLWREPAHYQYMCDLALACAATQTVAAKGAQLDALLRDALAKKRAPKT